MPLDPACIPAVLTNLATVAEGGRPRPIDIGRLTPHQFAAINLHRSNSGLPALESAVLVYVGRHHYQSRFKDGYTINDMLLQLEAAISEHSVVEISHRMTVLQSIRGRSDGYGMTVYDRAVLELTARKPKAEVFSVIPRGDGR